MTATTTATAKVRVIHDRFEVEPHLRKPNRYAVANKTGLVRDGYTWTDTLTGVVRHVDTIKDANWQATDTLRRESEIDWSVVVGWRADFARTAPGVGRVEIAGVDADGKRVESISMVQKPYGSTAQEAERIAIARARTRSWLKAVGQPDLPEVS